MRKAYLFFVVASALFAQNFSGGFNFYLPSSDTTTQKFLPVFPKVPIGKNDFVSIDENGKFSVNGKRIRFWGTNVIADAALPSKKNAGLISGRLRKFGINLIRLHHIDNSWSSKSLLGKTSTRKLNQSNLDLLENFIANLKDNGIYINMNLHVSRTFQLNDNISEYDSLPKFGKVVNFIDPGIIKLHKEYAKQLLTHVNPYTGKALVDDPVMAMVEITNENSLYRCWRDNKLKPIINGGILPFKYSRMLDGLWNDFLIKRYKTTASLKSSWNKDIAATNQNEHLQNGGFEEPFNKKWLLEVHTEKKASANAVRDNQNSYKGLYSAKIDISKPTGTEWHVQLKHPAIVLKKDSSYTISFYAKSNGKHNINVSLINDKSPWNNYGGRNFQITDDWKLYQFIVSPPKNNNNARLAFQLGKEKAVYWLDNVNVLSGGINGLFTNESLESKNVDRMDYADCKNFSDQRVKDLSEFYITLQRNYFKEMIGYLKNNLGIKVPIVGTNYNVGAADLASMSDADYVDNHAYWDYPKFPNSQWSQTDWLISNAPMVKDKNGGTIPGLYCSVPMQGKPFTVSEYNHPSPNIFQVESILFSAGYSSFNDADGFMYYCYEEPGDWNEDCVNNFFDINRNSIYMAFFPTAAVAFRKEFIKPSVKPIVVNYNAEELFKLPKNDDYNWLGPTFLDRKISLIHSVKTGKYFNSTITDFKSLSSAGKNLFKTDTDEITWNTSDGTIIVDADKITGAAGYLSKLKGKNLGKIKIIDFRSSDFGAVTWISLTGETLPNAQRSLITLGSKIQNTGMIWNSNYTSVKNNIGKSPTSIYPLVMKIDLNISADSIKVFPLDNTGKENVIKPFIVKPVLPNHFQVELDQIKYKTLWFGVETFGDGE